MGLTTYLAAYSVCVIQLLCLKSRCPKQSVACCLLCNVFFRNLLMKGVLCQKEITLWIPHWSIIIVCAYQSFKSSKFTCAHFRMQSRTCALSGGSLREWPLTTNKVWWINPSDAQFIISHGCFCAFASLFSFLCTFRGVVKLICKRCIFRASNDKVTFLSDCSAA